MNSLTRWWLRAPARRLRFIGGMVLVLGLVFAGGFYWKFARSGPTIDELLPGYTEQKARQNAILMGDMVVTLLGWVDALKDPAAEAAIIAGLSVLSSAGCFWVASLLEAPDNRQRAIGASEK
ncbi:MAG TPA: hypothetical protein VGG73_20805 [Vicinamibacterales bacterium]